MRQPPGQTYRQVALAMMDAAEAVERDGCLPAAAALTDALSDMADDLDLDAMLTITTVGVFITSLAHGVTARQTLDSLFKACD